jgi:hypothetical protein
VALTCHGGTEPAGPISSRWKFIEVTQFLRDTDKFATHILDKSWLLIETKPDTPLYISDNPIGLLQFSLSDREPMTEYGQLKTAF